MAQRGPAPPNDGDQRYPRHSHSNSSLFRNASPVPPYAPQQTPTPLSPPSNGHSSLNLNIPVYNPPYANNPPNYSSGRSDASHVSSAFAPSAAASSAAPLLPPISSTGRLPTFERVAAYTRGEAPPVIPPPQGMTPPVMSPAPSHMMSPSPSQIMSPPPHMMSPPPSNMQPTPSYLPPPDQNHPDLQVGFIPSQTFRYAREMREPSRSPSPGFDDSVRYNGRPGDVEQALMGDSNDDGIAPAYRKYDPFGSESALDSGNLGLNGRPNSTYKAPIDDEFESVPLVEEEKETRHFGPAPTGRVGRRNNAGRRIKQKMQLDESGMFQVDMPIPSRLAQFLPVKGVAEQKTTRYTAVTTDPDDFATSGVRLRQNMFNPPRQTELFIVITMYNEDAELFCRTLYGVMKNIAHLCGRKNSRVWGHNGWQKVVVCIVADGRKNVNPRVLDCLAALGIYQEGAMTNKVQDRPVTAHVFEYTTSFALDPDLHFKYPDKGIVPCQFIFCMKEKNAKKINSHRWFFNAFAPLLQPNVCILLDVGTMPGPKSIYHLWKAFDVNSNVGGACGEIATYKGKGWRLLLNPLVAAQNFEYKMSNILDKPMESLFGYCAVLPGAFSAYRYIALQNDADGKGPLASYFMGEKLEGSGADSFTANMYLAEDRVLCFEIVAKPKANWVLKYVKSAVGETDCPDTIPEFIGQRRRWLNGSFFAAVYALLHSRRLWWSGHSLIRKSMLMLEFFYNALNLIFGWFSLGNYYIFFVILTSALEAPQFHAKGIHVFNVILQYIYLGTLVACFIFAMGNRPQGAPWKYKIAIYIFAALTVYMLICGVLCIAVAIENIGSPVFSRMVVSLIATYGIFVISSILALDPWHIGTCFLQFLLFQPMYINILNIYAYSNLHDLSWGTKGSDTVEEDLGHVKVVGKEVEVALVSAQHDIDSAYQDALDNIRVKRAKVDADEVPPKKETKEQKQKDIYANFRTNLLLAWSLSNALLASLILSGGGAGDTFNGSDGNNRTGIYMLVILVFVAAMAAFRFICATMYLIIRLFGG
ncbi:hypothetical protein A1Q1_02345 [Trichosporon asahii var. asahii CBS 2479]|uniref:chitin synthase n=1 Tax=Trichosporon asahii var. asahii (strain ATCC 90039 / CBS 2479 / JCM 2466 / KCTC 7840 / NBRC 103889/ NCYC 2677 / UAMH 7654) TaxID=1186058 RepID=J5QQT8_TRIAS|nr:hypothetical protein A1Q1_02345 [Trichosporon asahii var. asahii CBS 2479]EJT48618.1 hypothetical protein A1Q1_02345 [Trichosporon asahii var. asahii CBS 2479]